jgi:hypothetical protein
MMEVMEGCPVEGGNIGVQKPGLWEPEVVTFLGATTCAASADDLLRVSDNALDRRKAHL